MMKEKIKNPILIAITGNSLMVIARIAYAGNLYYGFLLWNLLLAGIPLLISSNLYKTVEIKRSILYSTLALWLLFLPNSPYIITDLVHLYHRPPVPFWYDMLLVILSASNGLALGFISIYQVELIIFRRSAEKFLFPFRALVMLAMGYGVYIGRYLRFNSWDAIFNPIEVLREAMSSLHLNTAGFVLTFSFVMFILYSFFTAIVLRRSQEVF